MSPDASETYQLFEVSTETLDPAALLGELVDRLRPAVENNGAKLLFENDGYEGIRLILCFRMLCIILGLWIIILLMMILLLYGLFC